MDSGDGSRDFGSKALGRNNRDLRLVGGRQGDGDYKRMRIEGICYFE